MPRKPGTQKPDARNHFFGASAFTAIRTEDADAVASLKANLAALYQPVNSEELFAIERIALARHSLLRTYCTEAGCITVGLEEALEIPGNPRILKDPELTNGLQVTAGQNHSYWMAAGFSQLSCKSDWQFFLRYQAQTERLYRRAIEDFERIRALHRVPPNRICPSKMPLSPNPNPRSLVRPPPSPTAPATSPAIVAPPESY